ncbi:hypothetical protein [Roseinatronobacter sp. NSM]|uniref:hypothetical protein n=1 Tax=Roseinatronobacter sp. NSM TaxID=3457785 RepID=UPI0040362A1F
MSAAILAVASQIGAPLIRQVLSSRIGAQNTELATSVVEAVAKRAGVALPDLDRFADENPPRMIDAVRATEAMMPEMVALYAQGLEGQFALLQAEQKGHWLGWAWRPFMMWLLAFLWLWNIVALHVANAIWKIALPPTDSATLLGLTSVYMALYMGGHTLKDFVRVSRGKA